MRGNSGDNEEKLGAWMGRLPQEPWVPHLGASISLFPHLPLAQDRVLLPDPDGTVRAPVLPRLRGHLPFHHGHEPSAHQGGLGGCCRLSHRETLSTLPLGPSVKMGEVLPGRSSHYKLHLYRKINDTASIIFHTRCWSKVITPQGDEPELDQDSGSIHPHPCIPGSLPSCQERSTTPGGPWGSFIRSVSSTTAHLLCVSCQVLLSQNK